MHIFQNGKKSLLLVMVAVSTLWTANLHAELTPAVPPNIVTSTPIPMIFLNMSKDHQLSYRAYDEFSDLDGDGTAETTYKHSFDYYGYFDSYKCYSYSGTSSTFVPNSVTSNKYCTGNWSGNFLNWATMSRMDVLRKVLYGGLRSTDSATGGTVLERAYLPTDAHSFAKYYKGPDLTRLTPFDASQVAPLRNRDNNDVRRSLQYKDTAKESYVYPASMIPTDAPTGSCKTLATPYLPPPPSDPDSPIPPPFEDYNCVWFKTGSNFDSSFTPVLGDQIQATFDEVNNGVVDSTGEGQRITGTVISIDNNQNFTLMVAEPGFTGTSATVRKDWIFTNLSQTSATMCNTTLGASTGANRYSHTNTNPPLMRVAKGDYQLWNANERWQCYWSGEKGASNGNSFAVTGLRSSSSNPALNTQGVVSGGNGPDYTVRVNVCNPSLLGSENCRAYPDGNYQPVGLLQEYGENNSAEFALLTGSFTKNTSGGVIRSNMGSFRNEVNYLSNGTFTNAKNIVHTINKLRIYGYDYNDGTYIGADNCSYQLTGLVDGSCTSWGNPMGEMFLESLRYLGGLSATTAFNDATSTKDNALDLPKPAWIDPFLRSSTAQRAAIETEFGAAQCRAINTINFNASVTSYDHDQWTGTTSLPGAPSVAAFIDIIGAGENVHGNNWFVGSNGTSDNKLCTAKNVASLSSVRGLCPDAPSYFGSFSLAGLAHWARNNPVRTDIAGGGNDMAFKVKNFSVAMSPGKPRIEVTHPVNKKKIVIQPAYRLEVGGRVGGGTLVDFRVIEQTATSGSFLIIWEDSEQGGDYDQDASGIIRYEVSGDNLYVYTRTFADATANPQGFGYTISGTSKDGVHFHSGILNFSFNDLTNLVVTRSDGTAHPNINSSGGCTACGKNQPESRATYTFSGVSGGNLEDPLWYAAKWGGYRNVNGNTTPATPTSWDTKKLDGTAGADGIPDNYFLAIRPDELEKSLRSVFDAIVSTSNTAPAVASAQIQQGSLKYLASFDGKDGHGELIANEVLADGTFSPNAKWSAHLKLTATLPSERRIITNEGQVGKAFTWSSLSVATKTAAFAGTDATAEARLAWLRGDRSNESVGFGFRKRNTNSIMGSVVSSNPTVSSNPRADLFGTQFPGYGDFVTAKKSRKNILWVGAGDGMLHGFNAASDATTGGVPIISYVPQPLHSKLPLWVAPSDDRVQAFVDGSPFTADVLLATTPVNWATYLFSALGRGGKGMFALDVTNPDDLTEANAANIFKWQFTEADDNSGDLGYILSEAGTINRKTEQPGMVAMMNNGKFSALFPNGVYSTNGSAALYILFASGPSSTGDWVEGTHYRKLSVPGGSNNGLSQPTWVDTTNDGVADYIYAGDLNGNLWKFDVRCNDPAKWRIAYSGITDDDEPCTTPIVSSLGKPLYIAKASAPFASSSLSITTAPEYKFHPDGGLLVLFATGKAIKTEHFPDTSGKKNGIFAIWDKPAFLTMNTADLVTNLPRTQDSLESRTFTRITAEGDYKGMGYLTGDAFSWADKNGWFVNFPDSSEMTLSNPILVQGLLGVVSISPDSSTTGNCYGLPNAYITFIDPVTGLLNIDLSLGYFTDSNGKKHAIASIPIENQRVTFSRDATTDKCASGQLNCSRVIGEVTDKSIQSNNTTARIFWREIPSFKTQ